MNVVPYSRAMLVIAPLLMPIGAMAQVIIDAPGFAKQKTDTKLPDVKPSPQAWPRLDPGAVLCRTAADLERMAARRQGQEIGGLADCRTITVASAVTIIGRSGPGRTEVRLTDAANITGWTDAWLPEKAPAGAARR